MGQATRSWRLAGAVAGIVVLLDQATKQIVVSSVERDSHTNVFLGIDLTYVRNKGVAFGALGGTGALVTALTVGAVVAIGVYFAFHTSMPMLWLPFGAVAGGALGNLADRARDGAVVDFIDPILWPAFNLADAAIVVGILGLLYVIEGPRAKRGP
ncbi:MAG: signal peptidase [Thermoleophilaceae bacterium]|jgi:signal peptidase II|nr:signal peptidase [Thermoleophilaceae bacterium]